MAKLTAFAFPWTRSATSQTSLLIRLGVFILIPEQAPSSAKQTLCPLKCEVDYTFFGESDLLSKADVGSPHQKVGGIVPKKRFCQEEIHGVRETACYKIVVRSRETSVIRRGFATTLGKNEKVRPNGVARGLPMQRTCDTKRSLLGRKPFRGTIFLYVSESFS